MKNPCRDCADRGGDCHATCAKYRQWSTIRRAALEKDHDNRVAERYLHDLRIRLTKHKIKNRVRGRRG